MSVLKETIPLFPLNSVVFPKGRISLQIFETRYVDMIAECMRDGSGFGIVLIETGSEVARLGEKLDVHRVGTYCEMVDWNQLPSGLLGITAEGKHTFQLVDTWRENNQLCRARVRYRAIDSIGAAPLEVTEDYFEYVELMRGLSRHPAIENMNLDVVYSDLREVTWRLSELLPITHKEKQSLLEVEDTFDRLQRIELYISAMTP